jgi:DmsE family decaheme c-type cytochrome
VRFAATGSSLRLAAALVLAVAAAAVPACAFRRGKAVGRGRPDRPVEPPRDGPFAPRAPVVRTAPLPGDPDRGADPKRFSGTDSCVECHRDRWKSLEASFHAPLLAKGSSSVGCEECHGPGITHVGFGDERGIRHPAKAPREESNTVCLRCHAAVVDPKRPVRYHPLWIGERRVACVDCHKVHTGKEGRIAAHAAGPFADAAALEAAGATWVEPARCIQCHADYHPEMDRSGHGDLASGEKACAACHGNGSLHVAAGGLRRLILEPTKQEPAAADRACAGCHDGLEEPLLRWTCSEHRAENVACVACHDPNARRGATLVAKDPDLCLKCHPDSGAEFRLPSRHRVLEGAMKCADCHDPHDNESGFHRQELTREACLKCHPEKGGPFLVDHAAKNLEGCIACHRPHGTTTPRLLETKEVRFLCLSCHPALPTSHEMRPGGNFRNCLRCHVEIHGSDTSRNFFR